MTWPHGDASTYGNHGCRCRPCTDAWAARRREYNSARKARRNELRAKRALKTQRMREAQADVMKRYYEHIAG